MHFWTFLSLVQMSVLRFRYHFINTMTLQNIIRLYVIMLMSGIKNKMHIFKVSRSISLLIFKGNLLSLKQVSMVFQFYPFLRNLKPLYSVKDDGCIVLLHFKMIIAFQSWFNGLAVVQGIKNKLVILFIF